MLLFLVLLKVVMHMICLLFNWLSKYRFHLYLSRLEDDGCQMQAG